MRRTQKGSRKGARGTIAAALAAAALAGAWALAPASEAEAAPVPVTVYKSPTCGCCHAWIEHLEDDGFVVTTVDTDAVQDIKAERGVPAQLSSCHTAVAGAYTVEGHVPADVIRRLLAEAPPVLGIGVRGMPAGSPGMEQGGRKDPYAVLTFDEHGGATVFARRR